MRPSNTNAQVRMHTTDGSSSEKLASIIKRAKRPAPTRHTLTFCSLRRSLRGISVTIHEELRAHPVKVHAEETAVVMF